MFSFLVLTCFGLGSAHHLFDGRIVGGHDADIKDYPYQVSFLVSGKHWCGATLIKPNVVVTAAHCNLKVKNVTDVSFRVGSSVVSEGGQVANAVKICDHPRYNFKTEDYDVSVYLLDRNFTLEPKVQTIPLQGVNETVTDGTLANVTGWGRLSVQGQFPNTLQVVQVPKINFKKCKRQYKLHRQVTTKRMICFGYDRGGKDACQRDSGGPLVIDGKLVGIVSWGIGCAEPSSPGVYTKISHPKIQSHIKKCITQFGL